MRTRLLVHCADIDSNNRVTSAEAMMHVLIQALVYQCERLVSQ